MQHVKSHRLAELNCKRQAAQTGTMRLRGHMALVSVFLLRHTGVGLLRTAINAAMHKTPVSVARTGSSCNSTYCEIK